MPPGAHIAAQHVLRTCGHHYCYYAKFLFVSTVRVGPLKRAVCSVTEQNVHHTLGSASRCGRSAPVDAASCCQEKLNFYPCLPAASHVTPRPTYTLQDWQYHCPCSNGPRRFLLGKRVPGFPQALSSKETASGYVCAMLGRCMDGWSNNELASSVLPVRSSLCDDTHML